MLTAEQQERLNAAVDAACSDHSGALILRRIILGAYNGDVHLINLGDLRRLDDRFVRMARLVMAIAEQSNQEIHTLVDAQRRQRICDWAEQRHAARQRRAEELGVDIFDALALVAQL